MINFVLEEDKKKYQWLGPDQDSGRVCYLLTHLGHEKISAVQRLKFPGFLVPSS